MASRRLILRGLAAAGLVSVTAACGYRPLYGGGSRSNDGVAAELAKVYVPPIKERYGQIMRNEMEHAIAAAGREQSKVYTLQVALTRTTRELGILKDSTASRANIELSASFSLFKGKTLLTTDSMTTLSSYNILDNQYSTIVSQENAEERAARDLANRVIQQVSAFLADQPPT